MNKNVIFALIAAIMSLFLIFDTGAAYAGGSGGSCPAGTNPITIDGKAHCQVMHLNGAHCPAGQILVVLPSKPNNQLCAAGNVVGAQQISDTPSTNVGPAPANGGNAHCPTGSTLVTYNGKLACKGATHTVCDKDFYQKLVPDDAINVVWHQESCNFSYDIMN